MFIQEGGFAPKVVLCSLAVLLCSLALYDQRMRSQCVRMCHVNR